MEWWIAVERCPDCDEVLVAELPPLPTDEPTPSNSSSGNRTPARHQMAALELGDLDDASRWQLGLLLTARDVMYSWQGATLQLPATSVGFVEEFLEDIEHVPSAPPKDVDAETPSDEPLINNASPMWRRLLSWWIDHFLLGLLSIPLLWLWTSEYPLRVPSGEVASYRWTVMSRSRIGPSLGAGLVSDVLLLMYFIVGVALFGTTVGKRLLGLHVERSDGTAVDWGRAGIRRLIPSAGLILAWTVGPLLQPHPRVVLNWVCITIWPVVVYAPILFDPFARGLHDRWADTMVVFTPSSRR